MSLKIIKNKIRGVNKTHKVTKAMEAVSAVKMRKSQERALLGRPYAVAALNVLKRVGGSFDASSHPLVSVREVKRIAIVVVTSDKGLAGNLNSAVLKAVHDEIERRGIVSEQYEFICLGRKGYEHFAKRGFKVIHHAQNISDGVEHKDLEEITSLLANRFTNKDYDLCLIVFTSFISTFEHNAVVRILLPLNPSEIEATVRDITPARGRYAKEEQSREPITATLRYEVEPSVEVVLNELLPYLLGINVYHAMLEAKASEHSSRMVAMKNASDKARDMSKDLTREFNKERQTLITREVSEIVGGIEAMR